MTQSGSLVARLLAGAWRSRPAAAVLSPNDVEEITPLLLSGGAAALAWWRLRSSDLHETRAAEQLRQAYLFHAVMVGVHEHRIRQVWVELTEPGIKPLLGKGWAAARHYPEPGLRPYGDIDLYVRPEKLDDARRKLFGPAQRTYPVDLHRGVPDLDDRSDDELWKRSHVVSLDGVDVRTLGPEDHLRLLCLHMMRHGARRPIWLCDVGAIVESITPGFDWDYCLSGDHRRSQTVGHVIHVAHEVLEARIDGIPVTTSAYRPPNWLTDSVLRQWEKPHHHQSRLGSYLRNPSGLARALVQRWPNAIEAAAKLGLPAGRVPRLPMQTASFAIRASSYPLSVLTRARSKADRQA